VSLKLCFGYRSCQNIAALTMRQLGESKNVSSGQSLATFFSSVAFFTRLI
jgi:hypothetical protein